MSVGYKWDSGEQRAPHGAGGRRARCQGHLQCQHTANGHALEWDVDSIALCVHAVDVSAKRWDVVACTENKRGEGLLVSPKPATTVVF